MGYRLFLSLIILSLTFAAGCGKTTNHSKEERSNHASQTPLASEIPPFAYEGANVTKATIYLDAPKQIIAELTDSDNLNRLGKIVDHARPFSGAAPADLLYTIVLESRDGVTRALDVTGNGSVFIDQTTKISYELDQKGFQKFVTELKAITASNFEPKIAFDFPPGADSDEEEVIALVKKTLEAMVNKNMDEFHANLQHPDQDYLDFLIDTSRLYRFTKLERIEPYDASNGRKNIEIRFEYEEDGAIGNSGYIFTSRKNQEGIWKIENID
ncbi:hypothetical protein [Paenibacillus radicis (ex Gao et al. 2016)]|uniref:Lipoprotein n=1 Tax=Paenibacillus radicis (ex Gao et al. 2016) TaxID=1737354 RepID=A0A917LSW1_9BACL|nr:hypothetical protein [Paenibacillus radicis (ex Gao et al. 2016)]GGG54807.1 hypothetical protein GCM10010918_04590 [Paenibacillus radicis (ex Gao et al. 2016)]